MILTPQGLAQPLAPGVQTSFLGAGAGPPPAAVQQASGPYVVPMKTGICASPSFEPIFSATCPLPKKELDFVVDGLNTALAKSAPQCCRIGPLLLIASGFLTCFVSMISFGFHPALFSVGMALFAVGGFGAVFALAFLWGRLLTDIRTELSELNAQYNPRGIDFQLIEWREFVLLTGLPNTGYGPQMAGYGPQMAGYGPQVAGYGPQMVGFGPQVAGHGPQMAGYGPQMAGYGPQMTFRQVWKHALLIRALQPEQPDFKPSAPP